jgi:hypothetical protein
MNVDLAAGDTDRVDVVLQPASIPATPEPSFIPTAIPDTTVTDTATAVSFSPMGALSGILIAAILILRRAGR